MALVTVLSPSVAGSDGEAEDDGGGKQEKTECFFAGRVASLALKDIPQYAERRLSTDSTRSTNSTQSNNSDIQQHLQSMFYLLMHEETLKMAVKLESQRPNRTRYLVIASRCCFRAPTTINAGERKSKITRNNSARTSSTSTGGTTAAATAITTHRQMSVDNIGTRSQTADAALFASENVGVEAHEKRLSSSTCSNRQSVKCDADKNTASGDSKCAEGIEESCLLGIDCNERTTIGLVVPILADTTVHLDGDGGFSVSVFNKTHIFKPVSVQAMWSALQTLHKVSQKARENNFYPGGPSHDWLTYYENRIESDQSCLNEWNAMDSIESRRPPSPDAIRNKPTAKEETESVIKMKLKEIMMSVDLDEVTSKYIRGRLEEHLDMDLGEYKSFIDEEMLMILGQMDAPTEIFDHVYLGSEWNASNLEELQKNGVRHILNVTREIDNFFPGMFDYCNVRVYDDEKTDLLKHWDNTFRYITRAKAEGSKVLVHCKMGVSRSASVVIAYAMKAYNWEFKHALQHVKERRNCIKPNKNFLNQLETYRGMLDAMKNKEKLQRSKSETNLKSTKDARLLPGSEPTPLIQALNQSKSKSAGHGVSGDGIEEGESRAMTDGLSATAAAVSGAMVSSVSSISTANDHKHRRLMRRSSSTSPKSIQSHTAIVIKQQSQSLENLTPERSVADEPKNVRFPGSNGENYSVTQNQVLHIQKNTPPPPPPPPPLVQAAQAQTQAQTAAAAAAATSVRTIVHDLEAHRDATRKTADDRKTLNLQFGRSISQDTSARTADMIAAAAEDEGVPPHSAKPLGSPVWTSSAKLITQTSNIGTRSGIDSLPAPLRSSLRTRHRISNVSSSSSDAADMFSSQLDNVFAKEEETKRHQQHSRKTQSWAATSGGIIMDAAAAAMGTATTAKLGSNSSIDSTASSATNTTLYENVVQTRPRQRELPSRHASWGSGDNRCGVPMRNSSWGSFDTNRNTFQYGGSSNAATASAIFEGQIHELNMSNKTANTINISHTAANTADTECTTAHAHHLGTIKRTKQKLQESTALKKLCQENGSNTAEATGTTNAATNAQKRSGSNLYRSASAAGSTRSRFPQRCNSEEIVPAEGQQRAAMRRSDGSRPLQAELFSASAPESYTMSDIENKNTLPSLEDSDYDDETAAVLLRVTTNSAESAASGAATTEDQRISAGNVQILKKSFEAKAGGTTAPTTASATVVSVTAPTAAAVIKKGHQSLPSSPVAQHVEHQQVAQTTGDYFEPQVATATTSAAAIVANASNSSSCSSSSSASSASSVSEPCDRNVKCLVHKYQATSCALTLSTTTSNPYATTAAITTSATCSSSSNFNSFQKQRPRSYYETQKSRTTGKTHDYSESRPPPAPAKLTSSSSSASSTGTATPMTESILAQQQQQHQQRRLQQHGKTHPLARLSLPKQSFNAAAYNTM